MLIVLSYGHSYSQKRKLVVDQKRVNSSDYNPGTADQPFLTISKAAAIAQPGDTVFVHAGIYREWVAPAHGGTEGNPVTYMGAPNENVVIRGSKLYSGKWIRVPGHPRVFFTKIPADFFNGTFNPFKIVFSKFLGAGNQGQVFIDDKEIFEAKNEILQSSDKAGKKSIIGNSRLNSMYEQAGSWCTEDGETIYLHLPEVSAAIQNSVVEFSVRRHLFAPVRRAQNYINLKGFIFERCANDPALPQVGAVSCRSGQHWIIENNTIRNIKTIGLDCGAEAEDPWSLPDIQPEDRYRISGHHDIFTLADRRIAGRNMILNNLISDCGQCGIAGLFSDGSIIMGNTVERCGNIVLGFESGGIKIHGLMGGTIEGNLVRDNGAWGIWLDCGYIGSRVTRNVVVNNKTSGIFFECSNGPGLIDNNVIAYNRGDGIYTHDASGIQIANNLIFGNTNFGVYMCVATDRTVPPYYYATGLLENELSACSWERILNNIIVENTKGAIGLPFHSMRAENNLSDFNLLDTSSKGPRFLEHFRNGEPRSAAEEADEARKAFQKSGDGGLSARDLVLWETNDKGFTMNLAKWQEGTGNDKHSLTGTVKAHLDLKTLELMVTLDETINKVHCKPLTTPDLHHFGHFSRHIDKDFLANLMSSELWLPGAFQNFKPGNNMLRIWPVVFDYPEMPQKVAAEPLPGSEGLMPVPAPANYSRHK